MNSSIHNQTIALAGLAQAAYLVQQIAKHGNVEFPAVQVLGSSILKIDADNVEDVYSGLEGLEIGFRQLEKQLAGRSSMDGEQLNYAAILVYLEKKLGQNAGLLKKIRTGIQNLSENNDRVPAEIDQELISRLADLYQGTISTMSPRIVVNGEHIHLTNKENTDIIRALLLAGIRSAFLWRQCGGSRWKFVLYRKKILEHARALGTK